MYTAVLMFAMVASPESIDHGRRNCNCGGYSGGCCGGYSGGCCGSYYGGGGGGGGYYRTGAYGGYPGGSYYASDYNMMPYGSYGMSTGGQNYGSGSGYMGPLVNQGGAYQGGYQGGGNQGRQSFYSGPGMPNAAMVRVLLPDEQAEIWFDGNPTQQRGTDRKYMSGPMESTDGKYTYTVKARWMENGRAVEREKHVQVTPGQPVTVDFRQEQREKLSAPKSSETNK